MSSNFRPKKYRPLEVSSIKNFIENNNTIKNIIGDTKEIQIKEVGDGNLNLVFFVESKKNSICIKQPLPYLRVLKDWPLTLKRSYYESEYMNIHSNHVSDLMPKIYDFDPELCTITMEKLSPHIIMRHGLINATKYEKFAEDISTFMAKTLFFTSDLYLKADQKKELNSRFIMNTELCKITEDLIFTDPYMYNKNNRWTSPHLDKQKKEIENNDDLKIAVSRLKIKFMSETQSLLHGDLHTAHIVPEWYLLPFYAILRSVPDKLLGVVAMLSAILILAVLPWLDTSKIRSAVFRPLYKQFYWILVADVLILGYMGAMPAEGLYLLIARVATAYYFLHFLVILPVLGFKEKTLPIPLSITESVLGGSANLATAKHKESFDK